MHPWGCFAGTCAPVGMFRGKYAPTERFPGKYAPAGMSCPDLCTGGDIHDSLGGYAGHLVATYTNPGHPPQVWPDTLGTWLPRPNRRIKVASPGSPLRGGIPGPASAPHPSAKPTPQPAFPLMAFSRPPANRSLLSLAVKSPTASMVLPWVAFSRRNDPLSMPSRTLRTIR